MCGGDCDKGIGGCEMKNYNLIIAMVNRAKLESAAHKSAVTLSPYWYSGHKNKAKRAIQTARELLLEAGKELDGDCK